MSSAGKSDENFMIPQAEETSPKNSHKKPLRKVELNKPRKKNMQQPLKPLPDR